MTQITDEIATKAYRAGRDARMRASSNGSADPTYELTPGKLVFMRAALTAALPLIEQAVLSDSEVWKKRAEEVREDERNNCIMAINGERCVDYTGDPGDEAYNLALEHAKAAIRARKDAR